MAKAPEPGAVKTRLATTIGQAAAAELARAFLLDTWTQIAARVGSRPALVLAGSPEHLPALCPAPAIWPQGNGDLGERLERTFRRGLESSPWTLAVGTDSPGMPPRLITEAVRLLDGGIDSVIGPCADGGYYLIGLRHCPVGLLAGLPWSSSNTLARTVERLEARGIEVAELEQWYDVDVPADLERLRTDLDSGTVSAPETARALGTRSCARTPRPSRASSC